MYKTRYSFWTEREFPGFENFLKDLYMTSEVYFTEVTAKEFPYTKNEYDYELGMIENYIGDIEYHYASMFKLGVITKKNYDNILNRIKSLHMIKMMPKDNRKLYGLTYENQISINPDLTARYGLSEDCFKQMCLSHELGHIINGAWYDDSVAFSKELYKSPRVRSILRNMDLDDPKYLQFGFSLIDEVTTQEVAERVTYRMANRNRPPKEYRRDKAIFNHNPYITNYAIYGELQEFAIHFARSLNCFGVNPTDSDDEALLKLARRTFDKDFIQIIKKEILANPKKQDEFIIMLACMGKIKAATYQVLGLNRDNKSLNVNLYANSFYKVASGK